MTEILEIKVPQMGEGLQYTKVVRFLKQIGDRVAEDEDVVEVETEKANIAIATPAAGVVSRHACQPGQTMSVGSVLLEVERVQGASVVPFQSGTFNQQRKGDAKSMASTHEIRGREETAFSAAQRTLARRMSESQGIVVAASIERRLDWEDVDAIKRTFRAQPEHLGVPSAGDIICWSVSRAMHEFDKFRARMTPDERVEFSDDCLVGIALSGEGDTLSTPVISVSREDGFRAVRRKLQEIRHSSHTASGYHSVVISDMTAFQSTHAQPVVVYPAVATLFIGTPYWALKNETEASRVSNLVLTFDHRLINGVYAAKFLTSVCKHISRFATLTSQAGQVETISMALFGT